MYIWVVFCFGELGGNGVPCRYWHCILCACVKMSTLFFMKYLINKCLGI